MLNDLIGSFGGWIAGAGIALVTLIFGYFKARRDGANAERLKRLEADAKLRKQFDEIDNSKPDLDQSLERLRDRAE